MGIVPAYRCCFHDRTKLYVHILYSALNDKKLSDHGGIKLGTRVQRWEENVKALEVPANQDHSQFSAVGHACSGSPAIEMEERHATAA